MQITRLRRVLIGRSPILEAAIVLFALSLSACQPQERQPAGAADVDSAAVATTIDSLRALYEESVAASNFEALGSILAPGAVTVGPGGPAWDSLRAAGMGAPWPPGATLEIRPIEVNVINDEWAYEMGSSTATYTPRGANEARTVRDTYLVIFRNTDDGWKLYREVASPELPPDSLLGQ